MTCVILMFRYFLMLDNGKRKRGIRGTRGMERTFPAFHEFHVFDLAENMRTLSTKTVCSEKIILIRFHQFLWYLCRLQRRRWRYHSFQHCSWGKGGPIYSQTYRLSDISIVRHIDSPTVNTRNRFKVFVSFTWYILYITLVFCLHKKCYIKS